MFVHCKGGLGRAGTIAARRSVELGDATPGEAITKVGSARGSAAIEARAQAAHVHGDLAVQQGHERPGTVVT